MSTLHRPWIRIVSTVLVLALMTGIFLFSSQGRDSEATSEVFAFIIIDTIHPEYSDLSSEDQSIIWVAAQHIARKAAHIFEYMLLGFLILICLESWFIWNKKHKWLAFAIGSLYAVSDEIHQYFIPGRSCEIMDMLIDSLGVFLGVLLAIKLIKSIEKAKDRGDQIMEPWSKKKLVRSLLLALLFGALLTLCFELGMNFIRPNSVGSVPRHLIFLVAFSLVMVAAVLLCAFCRPIRNLWAWIDKNIMDPETRKPVLDIIYAVLAVAMLLHHFYVILYYPTLPAGATKFAPVWLVLAALTIIMGKTWRDRIFVFSSVLLIFTFERYYLKNLAITGEAAVYFFSAIYAMYLAYGIFFVVREKYRTPLLKTLCALWSVGTLILCTIGLYFAWTGNPIKNMAGSITQVQGNRLDLFAGSTISGSYTGIGTLIALLGFAISKHKSVKLIYILLAFISVLTTALTDARSSFIMIAFMLASTICIILRSLWYKIISTKTTKIQIVIFISLLVCFGLCFWGTIKCQSSLTNIFTSIRNKGSLIPSAQAEETILNTTDKAPDFRHRDIIISNDANDLDRTLSGRDLIWKTAIRFLQRNPNILFVGLTVDGTVATAIKREDHLHNIYFQILMEGGIPALLLFLTILGYFFYHTIRLWKRWKLPLWQRMLPLPALSILLLECAECLSHFSYGHPPMTLLWFFMGCTVAVSKSLDKSWPVSVEEKAIEE